jgi:hypothetical protein
MKKIILFVTVACIAFGFTFQDVDKIFSSKEIIFYGLDFSHAKFVGSFDQGMGVAPASGYDLKSKWIPNWNQLIANEQENYNLKDALKKEAIYYDIKPVTKRNSEIDATKLQDFNQSVISEEEIAKTVSSYEKGDKSEGVALVFIINYFNKNTKEASVNVVFFDVANRKVLLSDIMIGKPAGASMRNYWAGAIKGIIKEIGASKYNKWKKGKK